MIIENNDKSGEIYHGSVENLIESIDDWLNTSCLGTISIKKDMPTIHISFGNKTETFSTSTIDTTSMMGDDVVLLDEYLETLL